MDAIDFYNEVLKRVSIKDVLESYGMNINRGKTKCVFHNDNNPSMMINEKKNIAKCLRARINKYHYKRTILQTIDSIEQYVDYMQISRSTSEYLRKHIITQQLFKHQIL